MHTEVIMTEEQRRVINNAVDTAPPKSKLDTFIKHTKGLPRKEVNVRSPRFSRCIAFPGKLKWFKSYKEQLKCSMCDESESVCLDFHHLDPATKLGTITEIVSRMTSSKEDIVNEINKCIIVCKNCHAKIHSGIIAPLAGGITLEPFLDGFS